MEWSSLLSLRRQGDTSERLRKSQDETRLGFEVDYDRIIFSHAFRSLQDKTQVIPMPNRIGANTGFVHTRLTHSLEVSVVGRSLGRLAGKKILEKHPDLHREHGYRFGDFGAIVAAAALAHDIGNPPFGHSGEKAIGAYFESGIGAAYRTVLNELEYADLVRFEGNANGFKILTETINGVTGGLRLSYSTLGAFIKYPKGSSAKISDHIAQKKFGFFQKDQGFFTELFTQLGIGSFQEEPPSYFRHPLAFLVEAADDICYTIIDFEDGINLGWISEDYALEYLINLVRDRINTKKYNQLQTSRDRVSYLRALAIQTLIDDAVRIFMANEDEILNGSFSVSLMDKSAYKAQIKDIIDISVRQIYKAPQVMEKEVAGYRILGDILDVLTKALINFKEHKLSNYDKLILGLIPTAIYKEDASHYELLLQASCFVASLSDGAAVHLHEKISGKELH
ncbi:MAG: dNTP triphosphohydrolase [Flavobacteriaceae bacterium]|nr:dNTP triphosphohydrolase [Flavobacteriaceae bacterium]MDH3795346.1 dNTP triphosphohydrolase [Flavobacteriaceae bacterium]